MLQVVKTREKLVNEHLGAAAEHYRQARRRLEALRKSNQV
jgi:hypothetical protein